jgi:membrane dipeptidase
MVVHRREFMTFGAAAVCTAAISPATGRSAPAPARLRIDTLTIDTPDADFPKVSAAGLSGAVVDLMIYPRGNAEAEEALKEWNAAAASSASFGLVQRPGDFRRLATAGKFAVLLASQDAAILGPSVYSVSDANLENLASLKDLGLRVLQLTHNERNGVGDGFREKYDAGLSLLGEAVVVEMNRLGMLVDLSHCSDSTTLSTIRLSKKPVAVTHSGCRALYDSKRNKPDDVIRAIADRGGFFGVFMMTRWLTKQPMSSVEDVVDHIAHAIRIGGQQAVGFGSDQPLGGDATPQPEKVRNLANYQKRNQGLPGAEPVHGHVTAADLDGPNRMLVLERALRKRGYKSALIDGVLGANFVRVLEEVMSTPA